MSIVVRGARPHVDSGRVSAARPVSATAAAVGLKLVDDIKRLLERAKHVLLEESDVDVERLLAPVLPFRPDEVGEEVLDEGTLDRRPHRPLSARAKRLSARVIHVSARDWLTFGRPETYRLVVPIFSPLKYFSICASVSIHLLRFIKFLVRLERAWTIFCCVATLGKSASTPEIRKARTTLRPLMILETWPSW